jgi:type IV secretion system protein VirB10
LKPFTEISPRTTGGVNMPARRLFTVSFCFCASVLLLQASIVQAGQGRQPRFKNRAQGERSWVVPEGTVISMRMDSSLSSATSRAGDKFSATVTIPVYVGGKTVIPAGSVVEGHVNMVTPAKRRSQSGTIAVEFDELVFPNGARVPLRGTLTAADPNERQRIEDENRVKGSNGDRSAIFVGGAGALGAIIGAAAGGGKGAAYGGLAGAGVGIAGVLLSKGTEAEVKPGTTFGINLDEPLTVSQSDIAEPSNEHPDDVVAPAATATRPERTAPRSDPAVPRAEPVLPLNSPEMIRRAQAALKSEGYYEGQIDGIAGPRTSTAIRTYQRERNLPQTGTLDQATAESLGIVGSAAGTGAPASRGTTTVSRPDNPVPVAASPDPPDPAPARATVPSAASLKAQIDNIAGEYRRLLNSNPGSRFENGDIALLFALEALSSSGELYGNLGSALSDRGNMRAAAVALATEARRADRLVTTVDTPASRAISANWDAFRQEVLRLMEAYGISTQEIE